MSRRRGHEIDAADVVIRINEAPTQTFEAHVGTKTDVRFYGVPMAGSHNLWGSRDDLARPNAGSDLGAGAASGSTQAALALPIIACPPVTWVGSCWTELDNSSRPAHPRVAPRLWESLRNEMRARSGRKAVGKYPSTGAIAIAFALRHCRNISLWGFGNCTVSSLSRAKYYSKHQGRKAYIRSASSGFCLGPILLASFPGSPKARNILPSTGHSLFHDPDTEWIWRRWLDMSGAAVDEECGRRWARQQRALAIAGRRV
jgi:hypothetical protein